MSIRELVTDYSKGDNLGLFWRLFAWRGRTRCKALRDVQSFFLSRMAHRHGGYIGRDAVMEGRPRLPHGLHGIYISRYAHIGEGCCIYQNVTIGEIERKAPRIGAHCLIGAGAVLVGGIRIGDYVKIGAGAVVCTDVPCGATVVPPPSRVLVRGREHE